MSGQQAKIEKKPPFEPKNKSKLKEITIQSSILDHLELEMVLGNLFFQRINTTGVWDKDRYRSLPKGTHKGFPDIFVIKKGRMIFFEVKSSIGDQSDDQAKIQQLLEKQGAEYYIVRSPEYVKLALESK